MDELTVSSGPVWVCSQRSECHGRRPARKVIYKPMPPPAPSAGYANPKPQTTPDDKEWAAPVGLGGRARTICPSS